MKPTLAEAKYILAEYPNEDDYVQAYFKLFMNNGEADDNSIELSDYWNKCRILVEAQSNP